jgi:hypothetical protein
MPGAVGNDSPAAPTLTRSESPEITLDALQLLEESTSYHRSTSSSPLSDINTPEPASTDESCALIAIANLLKDMDFRVDLLTLYMNLTHIKKQWTPLVQINSLQQCRLNTRQ